MKVNPKNLILELLLAVGEKPMTAREAILACALFGISENSLRVTLTRLTAANLIVMVGRGAYRLGPAATDLADEVATWRTVETRLGPWHGGYFGVHCGALGRSDRMALQRRERALQMLGFRPLERGLYIRPDNLIPGIDDVRQRLYKLGLDREASVFLISGLDAERESQAQHLWDNDALAPTYARLRVQLEAWMASAQQLPLETAARDAFLVGGSAIHQLVFDPLLPEPFIDAAQRHAFIQAVQRFDETGRAIWIRLFDSYAEASSATQALSQPAELESDHESSH